MNDRIASLPMYDFDRDAVEAWWRGIALALQAEGVSGVPSALEWPDDLGAHWRDSRVLLSQTCGYPLMTTLMGDVQVVGAFCYTAPGCFGIHYRSELSFGSRARMSQQSSTAVCPVLSERFRTVRKPSLAVDGDEHQFRERRR